MKKAFSLIELLIVILIIGIVYTLSIGNFNKIKNETKQISLEGLKDYLQDFPYEKNVKILCFDDCSGCDIFVDDEKINEKEIEDFLDDTVSVYRYDFSLGMVKLEKDNEICFSYAIDRRGIGEQIFVEFNGKVYDFSTYLGSVPVYNSIGEATDAKEKLIQEVLK